MRKPIIVGNWKMNKSIEDSIDFINDFGKEKFNIEVGIAPQTISLSLLNEIKGEVMIGAQNVNNHASGAYTGEISADLLQEMNIDFCIIGHSERREYYNESNQSVNEKAKLLLERDILPIICVGETLEQYEAGETKEVIEKQIEESARELNIENVVIAYEPIWAIGTGKTATSQIAQDVCKTIRAKIAEMYSNEKAEQVRIQYGGSVKPDNIAELMACPDIDGALVGGASLELDSFKKIINY